METDWWEAPSSRTPDRFAFKTTIFGFATKEVKNISDWVAIKYFTLKF